MGYVKPKKPFKGRVIYPNRESAPNTLRTQYLGINRLKKFIPFRRLRK